MKFDMWQAAYSADSSLLLGSSQSARGIRTLHTSVTSRTKVVTVRCKYQTKVSLHLKTCMTHNHRHLRVPRLNSEISQEHNLLTVDDIKRLAHSE